MTKDHDTNNTKKHSQNRAKQKGSVSGVDFLHYTTQQISRNVKKYDNSIAKNTTKLNNLLEEPQNQEIYPKRLNSMDSTMLEEVAYNILEDSELKLEKRIEKIQNHIRDVDEKILVAEAIKDIITLEELNLQRAILEKNLENAQNEYKAKSVDTQMTSVLTSFMMIPYNIKKEIKKRVRYFLFHSAIVRKIKPLARSIMVRDTIIKLNRINNSVDELVKMKIPFGEQDKRYEKLISHLSHAGALHSQIMKELKG